MQGDNREKNICRLEVTKKRKEVANECSPLSKIGLTNPKLDFHFTFPL